MSHSAVMLSEPNALHFKLLGDTTTAVKKFHMTKRRLMFAVTEAPPDKDVIEHFKSAIHQAIDHVLSKVQKNDKIGVTLEFNNFQEKGPGYMTYRDADKVLYEDIWNIVLSVIQSDPDALSSDTFKMTVTAITPPRGKGKQTYHDFASECKAKKGIVSITGDAFNLARAVVVGKAFADKEPTYKIIRWKLNMQKVRAIKLIREIGDTDVTSLDNFQNHLIGYKIVVYEYGSKGRKVLFGGQTAERNINLIYHEGHYNVITSLTSAFSSIYFCENCHVPYNNKKNHRCEKIIKSRAVTYNRPTSRDSRRRSKYSNFEEECTQRRGIVSIKNYDNLCLPRALVVAKAHVKNDPLYNSIRQGQGLQREKALKLLRKAGLKVIPDDGAGIEELRAFQSHLVSYTIIVYKFGTKGREIYYKGEGGDLRLNLLFDNGHYNVITSLTAAFACSYFCEHCHVPYNNKGQHRCNKVCRGCGSCPPCEKKPVYIECEDCNRHFYGNDCYTNHLGRQCKEIKKCSQCFRTINIKNRTTPHICGEVYCKVCRTHKPQNHSCFIRQAAKMTEKQNTLFVYFDLETRQEKEISDGVVEHEVMLCVLQQNCSACCHIDNNVDRCEKCGFREKVLQGYCVNNFVSYLLAVHKHFKTVIAIAHNAQAFDTQFILNYLLTNTVMTPKLIMRGHKVLLMQVKNIKFIDSLNYFPMPLSALPAAFGLTVPKGYFPHLFNTKANTHYVGPLPDIQYYSPDTMKPESRTNFLKWYAENRNSTFDMQRDLVAYCQNDVDILRRACMQFRELFLKECKVDPFVEAITIASACNLVYRRNYLEENTIGVIPKHGYRKCNNQSKVALNWLIWMEQTHGISIQHAGRQKEAVVCNIQVDGFCETTNQVFQFHGCYFHGCPNCFNMRRDESLHDDPFDTMEMRYDKTLALSKRLTKAGYNVVEMWECDFRKLQDPKIKALENHPLLRYAPLNPREAFYGGRTEANRLKYEVKTGEKIRYVDVCSLYPWVCKYGKFPLGHPQIYIGTECHQLIEEKGLFNINGLIKCSILPPDYLYHPVLPLKKHGKLLFALCNTCSDILNKGECTHSEDERLLTGTWVIDEVIAAVKQGYELRDVQEIWQYQTTQYDAKTGLGGIFVQFINQFLKYKQEASGWPSHCRTQEDKNAYIEEFLSKEGIKLNCQTILANPGLRSLAKLILNSFWGKFGQRENQSKTNIISEPNELFEMLTNPSIDVNDVHEVNENVVTVNWSYKTEATDPLPNVNVVIAAYVTAHARLKLYSYLDHLKERVLYCDTDSVIYVSREGETDLPTGSFLGDLTNELQEFGPKAYITEFVSGGPKNYAYKVYCPDSDVMKSKIRVKGIVLDYKNSQNVNMDTMKHLLNNMDEKVVVHTNNIRVTKDHSVISKVESKTYRINFVKRQIIDDYDSVPYGFKRRKVAP